MITTEKFESKASHFFLSRASQVYTSMTRQQLVEHATSQVSLVPLHET